MIKKTKLKDKANNSISVGEKVKYEGEIYEVVKNTVPFNHYVIYNKNRSYRLEEVHSLCLVITEKEDVEMVDYDSWAEELQKSKADLMELLRTHDEIIKLYDKLKANQSTKEVDSIKQAVNYLLEADLREENGWNKEEIKMLTKVSGNDFSIHWK